VSDIPLNRVADRGAVLFYGLIALLAFAPLFQAGNRPLPLLVMELAALALLVWRCWSPPTGGPPLSHPARIFLALLFLLPLAQLLPAPFGLWADLPGRSYYAEALRQTTEGADLHWRAISLIPTATESAWLALLPPLAVFLAAIRLTGQHLLRLVLVFLGIATAEALLGLIQYGDGPDSVFRFGNAWMGESASGTYINRNHLAGLLEMALPVGLALLAATVGHGRPPHASGSRGRRGRTFRQWLARFSVARLNQAALFGAAAMAILLGLIFTRSRAGVSLAMLGILLSTLTFSYRLGGRNVYGLIGTFTAMGLGLASLIGLAPVWSRFTLQDPVEDGRWKIFDATLQAIGEFFPLGSGAGTFEEVMRRFHPADFPGVTINRAHNDYLEWLLEFGLIAGLLIAVWLLFYLRQWGRVWKRGEWTPFRFAQAGAGIALLLMMLHTLVDFNLRIPANAVFTAFLAAVFFHPPPEERRPAHRRRESSGEAHGEGPPVLPPSYTIPPENQANPFAE
jgi:O-antigen ligase